MLWISDGSSINYKKLIENMFASCILLLTKYGDFMFWLASLNMVMQGLTKNIELFHQQDGDQLKIAMLYEF